MVQAFLDTDIGKDRHDDGQASGIDLFALGGSTLAFTSSIRLGSDSSPNRQVPEGCIGFAQPLRIHGAAGTILLAGVINIIKPVAIALVACMAYQCFALRAEIILFFMHRRRNQRQ